MALRVLNFAKRRKADFRRLHDFLLRPHGSPSFFRYLSRRRSYWAELAFGRSPNEEAFPEYTKAAVRQLAENLGVRTPVVLFGPGPVADIRLESLPSHFVVKPNWGSSSQGVFVLERRPDGMLLDRMSMRLLDRGALVAELESSQKTGERAGDRDVVVEESLVRDGLRPIEYRVYMFGFTVGLILEVDANGPRDTFRVLAHDGSDLGRVRSDLKCHPYRGAPRNLEKIVQITTKVSGEISTGFVRVDVLVPHGGDPYLSELSFIPGNDQYYGRRLDSELGQAWTKAEAAVLREHKLLVP